jgi:hypothetical protein
MDRRSACLQCTIPRHPQILAGEETTTGAMTAFAIAVCSTSLVCYLLMTRPKHRRAKRSSHDSHGSDGGK